jgi:hypothetical protein
MDAFETCRDRPLGNSPPLGFNPINSPLSLAVAVSQAQLHIQRSTTEMLLFHPAPLQSSLPSSFGRCTFWLTFRVKEGQTFA